MFDFDIQKCTRRCAATDRELQPDEAIFSVLVANGSEIVRQDFSVSAWKEPPENAIGWWKSKMPSKSSNKVQWAPNDVLLHYLERLASDPTQADMVYVLALLLTRRRVLRLDDTEKEAEKGETLVLSSPTNENEYRIPVVWPNPNRITEIQDQLERILFGDGGAAIAGSDAGPAELDPDDRQQEDALDEEPAAQIEVTKDAN